VGDQDLGAREPVRTAVPTDYLFLVGGAVGVAGARYQDTQETQETEQDRIQHLSNLPYAAHQRTHARACSS
jgi:hypothetical protein